MKRNHYIFGAALVALGLTSAADTKARDSFDLVCTGHSYMSSWEFVDYGKSAVRIRVDLKSGKYCIDKCAKVEAYLQDSPAQLLFYDQSVNLQFGKASYDKAKSTYVQTNGTRADPAKERSFGFATQFEGTCKTRRFSGFPRNDAKR